MLSTTNVTLQAENSHGRWRCSLLHTVRGQRCMSRTVEPKSVERGLILSSRRFDYMFMRTSPCRPYLLTAHNRIYSRGVPRGTEGGLAPPPPKQLHRQQARIQGFFLGARNPPPLRLSAIYFLYSNPQMLIFHCPLNFIVVFSLPN